MPRSEDSSAPVGEQDPPPAGACGTPSSEAEAAREGFGRVVDRRGQMIKQRAMGIEHLGNGGIEQLLLLSKWL